MNILIYGYGLKNGGFYSASYFLKRGDKVRITDIRDEFSLGEGAAYLQSKGVQIISGVHRVKDFKWADITIKTPAVTPDNAFLQYSKKTMNDFSYLFSQGKIQDTKLIGIMGTQGKTITAAAVCHALRHLGRSALMCGNMGISPFTVLEKLEAQDAEAEKSAKESTEKPQRQKSRNRKPATEFIVCEFSSGSIRDTFEYMGSSFPRFELAAFTNTADDMDGIQKETMHLLSSRIERFKDKSKKMLCHGEAKERLATLIGRNARNIGSIEVYSGRMQKSIPENLRIAFAILRQLGFPAAAVNKSLSTFKGVPHRNEIVSSDDGLIVINDSASTIPRSTGFAVNNLLGIPIHLICGGSGKYLNPVPIVDAAKSVASITLLDGSFTREILIPALDEAKIKYTGPFDDMKKAVRSAQGKARSSLKQEGSAEKQQAILLSPGSSAFELFTDEFERGDAFRACFSEEKTGGGSGKGKKQKNASHKK